MLDPTSGGSGLLAGYPAAPSDEAVGPEGRLRGGYQRIGAALEALGAGGLARSAAALAAEREARGVVLSGWRDGRREVQPFAMDPVPRVLPFAEWSRIAAGAEQRHRALTAFLADVYRAAGRRRDDPDRAPELVRAGVLPEWAVAAHPARDPDAVALAWRGQPRAGLAAVDVVSAGGRWVVVEDALRVPAGLGYALANRRSARAAVGRLFPGDGGGPLDPQSAVPLLRTVLADAAPPGCPGSPSIAVLTSGEGDAADFESRLLADALGVPLVRPGGLWPRSDGGLETTVDGERIPVDVLHRRLPDGELGVHRTPTGQALAAVLRDGVRAGRVAVSNVPGNAVADDRAAYAWVPAMIRFYLGEEPLLGSARTWVLADPEQWAQVRDRLHELLLKPVGGYGGGGVVDGRECSAADLAQLQAEVAASPHRFIAQEPLEFSTAPVFADGALAPRPVELRVFSAAGADGRAVALPAPLTRVRGGPPATKDTWLVR